MRFPLTLSIFALLLLATCCYNTDEETDIKCQHDKRASKPEKLDIAEVNFTAVKARSLQTTTYPNIRMTTDYTNLVNVTQEFRDYVQKDLIPPIIDYFQAALKIKYPIATVLKLSLTSVCGFTTPNILRTTGVATDFYIMFTGYYDSGSWVASSTPCYISSGSGRAFIAKVEFNTRLMPLPNGDPLVQERNTYLTMHEFTHSLGFTSSLYSNFRDANGNLLTGHIKTTSSGATVLDVAPLTEKLRRHFGCSTIEGATMEDDGSSTGSVGSHFERRYFLYEYMTSGVLHGRRVSELTLALLEGSGWYIPDYSYAEPFFFGQGQGCGFLSQTCSSTIAYFDEFCIGSGRGCSPTGRGGGICSSDAKSDGCKYYYPYLDYDCQNPGAVNNARFPTREIFGRSAGSKCFTGNLTTSTSTISSTSMCYQFNCTVQPDNSTNLLVTIGQTVVNCTQEAKVQVSGLNGLFDCPDPLTFCNTVAKPYCPRNCMGRGTCVNNSCVCNSGFTGIDCGLNAAITY